MDFDNVCRTCLTVDGILFSVFDPVVSEIELNDDSPGVSAAEMLRMFTAIVITPNDGLPDKICTNCLTEVHNAHTFKLKSESSQLALNSLREEFSVNQKVNASEATCRPSCIQTTSDSANQQLPSSPNNAQIKEVSNDHDRRENLSIHSENLEELFQISTAALIGNELNIPLEELSDDDMEMLNLHLNLDNLDEIAEEMRAFESISMELNDNSNESTNHSENMANDNFKCVACSKQYEKIGKLRKHVVDFHTERNFCKICNTECELKMWKHVVMHLPAKLFPCSDCSKSFHSRFNLQMHRKMAHDDWLTCEYCSAKFRNLEQFRDHVYIHTGKHDFQCDICFKVLKRRSALLLHKQNHDGKRPFKCEHCGKTFGYKGNLKFHMIASHGGDQLPLKCDICLKRFKNRPQLVKHKFEHTGNTELQCDVCLEVFETRYKLGLHRRKHTGEKPLKCEICGRGFRLKCNLKEHLGTHSEERPFQCQLCPCRYKRSYLLTLHVKKLHPERR